MVNIATTQNGNAGHCIRSVYYNIPGHVCGFYNDLCVIRSPYNIAAGKEVRILFVDLKYFWQDSGSPSDTHRREAFKTVTTTPHHHHPHPTTVSKIPAQTSSHSFHINGGGYIDSFLARSFLKRRRSTMHRNFFAVQYTSTVCRPQWLRGLRPGSATARMLRLWVRISQGELMYFCCECC